MPRRPVLDKALSASDVSRRDMLGLVGVAGVAALVELRARGVVSPLNAASGPLPPACVVTPAETEGPYFIDERLERSDLRVDPTNQSTKPGAPLRLRLNVSRVDGTSCAPVTGAFVDIWQCDALGVYSDVRDMNGLFDTRGQKFLRGHQITDKTGAVEFLTLYPGWYAGRAVHIHFKVRVFAGTKRSFEFTSQLYFDDALTDRVHAEAPYNTKGMRDTRNDLDMIYRSQNTNGAHLLVPVAKDARGYAGQFSVGLKMS